VIVVSGSRKTEVDVAGEWWLAGIPFAEGGGWLGTG
jgi:hypothetical protein